MPVGSTEEPHSDEEERAVEPSESAPDETRSDAASEASEASSETESPANDVAPAAPATTVSRGSSPQAAPFSPLEYFLLPTWQRDTEKVDAASRRRMIDQTALSQQRRSAAETLWAAGHPADALALARHAYLTAAEAHASIPEAALTVSQRAARASKREQAVLAEARKNEDRELPKLDPTVQTVDEECYQTWLDAQAILVARCRYFSANRQDIRVIQTMRIGTIVVILLVAAIAFWWSNRRIREVTSSGSWNNLPQFVAENAFDGDPSTEWLLPDNVNGWVQLDLRPARSISAVRVTNGYNPPVQDRAVRDFRVELYRDGEHLRDLTGSFDGIDPSAPAITLDADVTVDRVRFVVVSHHGTGGALAEIALEE